MEMQIIEQYLDELLEKTTVDIPAWNIEKARAGRKSSWDYIDGCMIMAVLEYYNCTGNEKYLKFADTYEDYRVHEDGSIDGFELEKQNLDDVNGGKNFFELYRLTGKEKYRKALDTVYELVKEQPRTKEGNFWHKKIYPNQVWLDGLYMAQPFYMEYETKFNNKKNYDDIFNQFFNVAELLRDKETGLYYHAYDSSREMFWCNKETGLSKHFWLRALGWYSMALLDTLYKCDKTGYEAQYEKLKGIFIDLMETMVRFQDESGMWYQVVDMGGRERNYLETSGSSIMAYCMLKGARLGILPEKYREYGKKAFQGVCDKYLVTDTGRMSLGGICLVAGLGGPSMRDGSYDYYMSEPVVQDDAKGVGPFLLAYSELRRL